MKLQKSALLFLFVVAFGFPAVLQAAGPDTIRLNDFLEVVRHGSVEELKKILPKIDDINVQESYEELTPLGYLMEYGYEDVLGKARLLVENGAKINVRSSGNETPLLYAAYTKDAQVVEYLLEVGAYIRASNDRGDTALHKAIQNSDVEVVKVLLNHGAELNRKNRNGATPLDILKRRFGMRKQRIKQYLAEQGLIDSKPIKPTQAISDWGTPVEDIKFLQAFYLTDSYSAIEAAMKRRQLPYEELGPYSEPNSAAKCTGAGFCYFDTYYLSKTEIVNNLHLNFADQTLTRLLLNQALNPEEYKRLEQIFPYDYYPEEKPPLPEISKELMLNKIKELKVPAFQVLTEKYGAPKIRWNNTSDYYWVWECHASSYECGMDDYLYLEWDTGQAFTLGYYFADNMFLFESNPKHPKNFQHSNTYYQGRVNESRVNFRDQPSTKGKKLGYLDKGELVEVLESSKPETIGDMYDHWYRIRRKNNQEGWIYGWFLEPVKD